MLEDEKKANPVLFAKTMQVAGISAFYANDIQAAIERLQQSYAAWEQKPDLETMQSRARTKHFLGLAFKNWCVEEASIGKNLEKSAQYLREAYEATKEDQNEFLTPVTLAEVLSYLDATQSEAQELLVKLIERLQLRSDMDSLGPNERVLFLRCYLLKGNIAYKTKHYQEALKCNSEALNVNKDSHYARLSVLQSEYALKRPVIKSQWDEALRLLESSGATRKREITTRGTALAWGLLASFIIQDQVRADRFRKEFEAVGRNTRSIDNKIPIFFSPVSKNLLKFPDLEREMDEFAASVATGAVKPEGK